MIPASHPWARAQALLTEVVAERDVVRLGECLRGMHLPVLGGNEDPADILARIVGMPTTEPELAFDLAELLGSLLQAQIDRLEIPSDVAVPAEEIREDRLNVNDETLLHSALVLACSLPADAGLFRASRTVAEFLEVRPISGIEPRRLAGLLRYVRIYQQADNSLEEYWLELMRSAGTGSGPLTPNQRTIMLDAWRGLLWIPPSTEAAGGSEISFRRIERGLSHLYELAIDHEAATSMLKRALEILIDAFPRSPSFWRRELGQQSSRWTRPLRELLFEIWPGIRAGLADALRTQGRYSEAEREYRASIALGEHLPALYAGLGATLLARGHDSEAEKIYREGKRRWPDDQTLQAGLAKVLFVQDRYAEAEFLYRTSIEHWPDNAVLLSGLAETLRAQGRYSEALYSEPATNYGRVVQRYKDRR